MTSAELSLSVKAISLLEGASRRVAELCTLESVAFRESAALRALREDLVELRQEVVRIWHLCDHAILRGVPFSDDGSTALVLALVLFDELKTYRGGQIVKHFQMSPWTKALSHTLAEGHFHTDINTSPRPPVGTLIQCLIRDPDAPRHGQLRIARLADLMDQARRLEDDRFWRFLTQDEVTMVNDTSPGGWTGRIVEDQTIRVHPETLRAGQRRHGGNPHDLEDCLQLLHRLCMEVSYPIDLKPGEVLVVSNHRALHQRSGCTVQFLSSPRNFKSRKVAVLHSLTEPS